MNIVERYPLHCGNTVLQLSKLILMKFMVFLNEYLIPSSFEIIYSGWLIILNSCFLNSFLDTDSVCLCTTDDLENIVKPIMKDQWPIVKSQWFVLDPTNAYDARFPGKMKEEWATDNGKIIWYLYVKIKTKQLKMV